MVMGAYKVLYGTCHFQGHSIVVGRRARELHLEKPSDYGHVAFRQQGPVAFLGKIRPQETQALLIKLPLPLVHALPYTPAANRVNMLGSVLSLTWGHTCE